MRIFLIYHGRFPSEKAASLFAGKSAEAFADVGADVMLLVPNRRGRSGHDAYDAFDLRRNFKTVYLPSVSLYGIPFVGRFSHRVSYFFFALSVLLFLFFNAKRSDCVYSNESWPLFVASLFFSNTTYEVHDFPEKNFWFYRLLFRRVRHLLATNLWKARELERQCNVPRSKIIVELNAVDLAPYENAPSRKEARTQLNLPMGKTVVYTGHLYSWKGVDTLIEAARLMPEVAVYLVGGTEHYVREYRRKYGTIPNLHIIGHRSHDEMPLWQKAADVLVLPNTAKEEISARYTSPMKLFEYMASGTPIVASDLPSVREIADNNHVFFVEPDNAQMLATGVQEAFRGGDGRSARARAWVSGHTWGKRAERIVKTLS